MKLKETNNSLFEAAAMFAYIGYVPIFFVKEHSPMYDYLNGLFATFLGISIMLFVIKEMMDTKNYSTMMPYLTLFGSIALLNAVDYLKEDWIKTHKPYVTLILIISTCYLFIYLLQQKLKRQKKVR